VFVKFNDNIPIPFLCNIKSKIVCECKNWKSRKVDVGMVSKLAISSLGYGLLWNNPGIGKVSFAKNMTEWKMFSTNFIDYWITCG
ncbi:hypothetical protein ACTPEM_25255, partial [Clostridioides difficile]